MKKYIGIIILAAMLSMTGCGGTSEETADTAITATETAADAAIEEAETETTAETIAETEIAAEAEATEAETSAEENASAEPNEVFALNGPMARYQGVEEFGNAKFAASFDEDDFIKNDDGTYSLTVMIYGYERFSGSDITALKKGDTIWCLGEEVVVETVETTDSGAIAVNGGIENGGRVFKTDDDVVYFESGLDGRKNYYEIGLNTYQLSSDFVLTDDAVQDDSKTYTAEEFMSFNYDSIGFTSSNTIVETKDDVVIAVTRNYIP